MIQFLSVTGQRDHKSLNLSILLYYLKIILKNIWRILKNNLILTSWLIHLVNPIG